MSFELCSPTPPNAPLEECTDAERRITTVCWDLQGVQTALASGAFELTLAGSAQRDLFEKLNWDESDLLGFFSSLSKSRYWGSEWALPSGHGGAIQPMKADAYFMGYNRFKGIENQNTYPWVYMKFSVRETHSKVMVLSVHPQKQK